LRVATRPLAPLSAPLWPLAPFDADPGAWDEIATALTKRPFLYSEGMGAAIGTPQRAAPWLVERSRRLVGAFHRFYAAIIDAEGPLAAEPARALEDPYERFARLEGKRTAPLLGRYDCVLDAEGGLRVIELNPVGVCTLHLRAVSYLERALLRRGLVEPARAIAELREGKLAAVRRYCDETLASRPSRPTAALVLLPGMHRGSKLFWRRELGDAGFEVVDARPDEVRVDGGRVRVAGRAVDVLWVDWFLYLGYQQRRYEQTRFASKVGDYSKSSSAAEALINTPGLDEALRDRAVTFISPMRSYRALSKALLAWIERPALPISDTDREVLREHVTRTHDHSERLAGVVVPEDARARKDALVLKPCRFGGSHGVTIGRDTAADEWARRLEETWSDPEWVLQAFSPPALDARGHQLSLGVYDYGGELGGILVRTAPQTIVSARTADIVVAVTR
jgi:hypothetical protein